MSLTKYSVSHATHMIVSLTKHIDLCLFVCVRGGTRAPHSIGEKYVLSHATITILDEISSLHLLVSSFLYRFTSKRLRRVRDVKYILFVSIKYSTLKDTAEQKNLTQFGK